MTEKKVYLFVYDTCYMENKQILITARNKISAVNKFNKQLKKKCVLMDTYNIRCTELFQIIDGCLCIENQENQVKL